MDDIQPTNLSPWIGFLYTFPDYRGHNYAGMLLDYAESIATVMEREYIYISTNHVGLYEKYGYEFYNMEKDINGEDSRVYRKALTVEGAEKDGSCPNVDCCQEKGIDGCFECDELANCTKGFYKPDNNGAYACKAQALFIKKYGKEKFVNVHDKLHEVYDFQKTQEILGRSVEEGLKILEENMQEE